MTLPAKKGPGRPKGSKNRTTVIREEVQEQAIDLIKGKVGQMFVDVMDQALAKRDEEGNMVEHGCKVSQKLIADAFGVKGSTLDNQNQDKLNMTFKLEVVSFEEELAKRQATQINPIEVVDYEEIDE